MKGSLKGEPRGAEWLEKWTRDEPKSRETERIRRILLIFVNDKSVYIDVHAVCKYV